jgi:hypothetical protein
VDTMLKILRACGMAPLLIGCTPRLHLTTRAEVPQGASVCLCASSPDPDDVKTQPEEGSPSTPDPGCHDHRQEWVAPEATGVRALRLHDRGGRVSKPVYINVVARPELHVSIDRADPYVPGRRYPVCFHMDGGASAPHVLDHLLEPSPGACGPGEEGHQIVLSDPAKTKLQFEATDRFGIPRQATFEATARPLPVVSLTVNGEPVKPDSDAVWLAKSPVKVCANIENNPVAAGRDLELSFDSGGKWSDSQPCQEFFAATGRQSVTVRGRWKNDSRPPVERTVHVVGMEPPFIVAHAVGHGLYAKDRVVNVCAKKPGAGWTVEASSVAGRWTSAAPSGTCSGDHELYRFIVLPGATELRVRARNVNLTSTEAKLEVSPEYDIVNSNGVTTRGARSSTVASRLEEDKKLIPSERRSEPEFVWYDPQKVSLCLPRAQQGSVSIWVNHVDPNHPADIISSLLPASVVQEGPCDDDRIPFIAVLPPNALSVQVVLDGTTHTRNVRPLAVSRAFLRRTDIGRALRPYLFLWGSEGGVKFTLKDDSGSWTWNENCQGIFQTAGDQIYLWGIQDATCVPPGYAPASDERNAWSKQVGDEHLHP